MAAALVIMAFGVQYDYNLPPVQGREGIMDELIARLVAKVGVDRDAAEKAVGVIFEFLLKEGPHDKVMALIQRLPGAEQLMESQDGIDASGGGGFAMMSSYEKLDAWIDALPDWQQAICREVRELVHAMKDRNAKRGCASICIG